ncbi:Imm2 family immunity protein [Pseudomonas protegens]|uniref:Imm2 family immunity protein n=1 Tax=Pseudomonas protegens TaxID=380021 RepID=UPI000F4B9320|nr:Imm2 family immunity protein [Pseudomonas protegens]
MEDRVTYSEVRACFLALYYNYCRVKLRHNSLWIEGESEAGYAYAELEGSFDKPVEILMLEVVALVLRGGRSSERVHDYHRAVIEEILRDNDLLGILEGLPQEEAMEFSSDLRLLGMI